MTRKSSRRSHNQSELLSCPTLQAFVGQRFHLACSVVFLGNIAFCCMPSVPFCLSLLTFCRCLLPFIACLSILSCAFRCLPFAVAFCLSLLAFCWCLLPLAVLPFAPPANRRCLPGRGRYYKAAKLAEALEREHHYTVDEKQKSVLLTEQGYEDAEDVLEVWVILGSVRLHILSPAGSAPRTAIL